MHSNHTSTQPLRLKLLVVDGDDLLPRLLPLILDRVCDVTISTNAENARQAVRDEAFDVVLASHPLEDASGLELLDEVRERCPRARRLLMSEASAAQAANDPLWPAAELFMKKPVVWSEVRDFLRLVKSTEPPAS